MAKGILPLCFSCRRFKQVAGGIGYVCEAYEQGIPVEIMASVHDHHEPYKGDHGLQYEGPREAFDEKSILEKFYS